MCVETTTFKFNKLHHYKYYKLNEGAVSQQKLSFSAQVYGTVHKF